MRVTTTCVSASNSPAEKLASNAQRAFDARGRAGRDAPVSGGGVVHGVVEPGGRELALAAGEGLADLVTVVTITAGGGEDGGQVRRIAAGIGAGAGVPTARASLTTRPVRRRSAGGSFSGIGSTVGAGMYGLCPRRTRSAGRPVVEARSQQANTSRRTPTAGSWDQAR